MHIHIYVKLGFWHRLGIFLTLISAACLMLFVIRYSPTQADVLPCLTQLEIVKPATTEHQEILRKCNAELIKSSVEVQQLGFIVKSILIWIGAISAVYAIFLAVLWVWRGAERK